MVTRISESPLSPASGLNPIVQRRLFVLSNHLCPPSEQFPESLSAREVTNLQPQPVFGPIISGVSVTQMGSQMSRIERESRARDEGGRSRGNDRSVRDRTHDHVGRDRGHDSRSQSRPNEGRSRHHSHRHHHQSSRHRQPATSPAARPAAAPPSPPKSAPAPAPAKTAAPSPQPSNLQKVVHAAQTVINPGPTIAQKAAEAARNIAASTAARPAPTSPPKSVPNPAEKTTTPTQPSNLQKAVHVAQHVINPTPILVQKAAEVVRNHSAPTPQPAQVTTAVESQEARIERIQRHIQRINAERAKSQNGEVAKATPPPSQPNTAIQRAIQVGNTLTATPSPLTRAIETGKELFKSSSPSTPPSTTPQAANDKTISPPKPPPSTGNPFVDYHAGLFRGAKRAYQEHKKEFLPNVVGTIDLAIGMYQNPLGHALKTAQATHELVSALKDANASEVIKGLAPELSKLVSDNEKLSDAERGELAGYVAVKYVPYIIPLGAEAKAPQVAQRAAAVTTEVRSALKLAEELENGRKVVQAAKTAEGVAKEAGVAQKVAAAIESSGPSASNLFRVGKDGVWEIQGKSIKKFDVKTVVNESKLQHVFNNEEHQLSQIKLTPQVLVEKVTAEVIKLDQAGVIPANQPFVTRVTIDGHLVEVRGIVDNGELRFGTFFIPKKAKL